MRADPRLKNFVLGRSVGQTVFCGRNLNQKDAPNTCDFKVTLMEIMTLRRTTVAVLHIFEEENVLEVALMEKHPNPVEVQGVHIFYEGTKMYSSAEVECARCGQETSGVEQRRTNGLLRFEAPSQVKIFRGNRIGKNAR